MRKQKYEEGWSTKYREAGVLSQLRKILEAIIKRKAMIMCQINESYKFHLHDRLSFMYSCIYASAFLPTLALMHSSLHTEFVFQFIYQIWSCFTSSLYFCILWINVQTPLCGIQILHDLAIYHIFLQLLPSKNHLCHALLVKFTLILRYLAWSSLMQTASDCYLLFLHYKVELVTPTPLCKNKSRHMPLLRVSTI